MRVVAILLCSALLLGGIALLRAPEYDEAYSIFLTAGDARPEWPIGVFYPGEVRGLYQGNPSPLKIAYDLRTGDVHPPLYFWALEYWRRLTGPSWFGARLLSVLFSIAALAALAWLAALAEIPVASAMLIALLSYGFAYTGIIARGFALAQLLNIFGFALVLSATKRRKWNLALAGGLIFGAAGFTNYLAVFIGLAGLSWLYLSRNGRKILGPALIGFAAWIPPIAYFFLAQRNSRTDQFEAFSPIHAIAVLAKDCGAVIFGGLPEYAGRAEAIVTLALALLFFICAGYAVKKWQPGMFPFALAALATPVGLLALGFVFNNTPIEIRYLAFSMPFMALLFAKTLPKFWLCLLLTAEACGTLGLATAPATMQPQGLAAHQITAIATPSTLVLIPFGNDGVGIPGPFIATAPNNLRLQFIKPNVTPDLEVEHRVILATINVDAASKLANAELAARLSKDPRWTETSGTNFYKVFIRTNPTSLNHH